MTWITEKWRKKLRDLQSSVLSLRTWDGYVVNNTAIAMPSASCVHWLLKCSSLSVHFYFSLRTTVPHEDYFHGLLLTSLHPCSSRQQERVGKCKSDHAMFWPLEIKSEFLSNAPQLHITSTSFGTTLFLLLSLSLLLYYLKFTAVTVSIFPSWNSLPLDTRRAPFSASLQIQGPQREFPWPPHL